MLKSLLKYPISRKARNRFKELFIEKEINSIKLIMTLLVKNEEEILEKNIRFHKAMGVDGFVVTTHNSTDKTNEILEKLKAEGLVLDIIYETDPVYRQAKFVDKMIKLAKRKYKAEWIINADADEFYYSKNLNLKKDIYKAKKAGLNMMWVDSVFLFPDDKEDYLKESHYFVTKPFHKFEAEQLGIRDDEKFAQFIGSQECYKVIHNTKDYKKIHIGNHFVNMKNKNKFMKSATIVLYHYNIRNYKQLEDKVKRYIDTTMPTGCGLHMMRMIELYKQNLLRQEHFDRYFSEDMRNFLVKEGVVSIDKFVSNFFKGIENEQKF